MGLVPFVSADRAKQRTALVSVAFAALLVALKLGTGVTIGSLGLISAGLESSGDVLAALLTVLVIRVAGRPADQEHPYGHARAENLGALAEAAILVGGVGFIVLRAVQQLSDPGESEINLSWPVFVVLGVVVVVDAWRTAASMRTANRHRSAALRSNAFHFGADLLGTMAVIGGLLFTAAGYRRADAMAALIVAVIILVAAARLIRENVPPLMDHAPAYAEQAVRDAIAGLLPPVTLHRLRLREAAGRFFVDVEIGVTAAAGLGQAHERADAVEAAVGDALPGSDVVVHVEPDEAGSDVHEAVLAAALSVPSVREAHNVAVVRLGAGCDVSLHVKLPADTPLADAHRIGSQVEENIRARVALVRDVQTHLEPLKAPVRGLTPTRGEYALAESGVRQVVAEETGYRARLVRFLEVPRGLVVYVTLVTDDSSLGAAHARAVRIEDRIRTAYPRISDVVVHTEPSDADPSSARARLGPGDGP